MEKPRRIHVADLRTTTQNKVIEVKVIFSQGGINYATYKTEKKGYYLIVTPVELKDGARAFMMFSGVKALLEETARYSAKRLQALADVALDFDKMPKTKELIDHVCQEGGLTLDNDPPPGFKDSMGNEY
jgi:hypothetical protein